MTFHPERLWPWRRRKPPDPAAAARQELLRQTEAALQRVFSALPYWAGWTRGDRPPCSVRVHFAVGEPGGRRRAPEDEGPADFLFFAPEDWLQSVQARGLATLGGCLCLAAEPAPTTHPDAECWRVLLAEWPVWRAGGGPLPIDVRPQWRWAVRYAGALWPGATPSEAFAACLAEHARSLGLEGRP